MPLKPNFPELNTLIHLLPGYVYILDTDNVYRGCNELQAKSFGLKNAKEIIGKRNKDMPIFKNYPELAKILDTNNLTIMKKGEFTEIEEDGVIDGDVHIFKSYKLPLLDKAKKVIGLLGISHNINIYKSELKVLQNKYVQNELALENIMDYLPGHIYWTDKNNNFLGCNSQQAYDVGLKNRYEIVGRHITSFQTSENGAVIIKNNNKVLKTGEIISIKEKFQALNGEEIVYLSRKAPLKNKQGEIVGVLGISIDITSDKKLSQLEMEHEMYKELEKERSKALRLEIENDLYRELQEEKSRQYQAIEKIFQVFQSERINFMNHKINGEDIEFAAENIALTKREREVLYFLAQHQSPKEIAFNISKLSRKTISPETVQSVINKQLYPKFNVADRAKLIQKATLLKLIPYILENI